MPINASLTRHRLLSYNLYWNPFFGFVSFHAVTEILSSTLSLIDWNLKRHYILSFFARLFSNPPAAIYDFRDDNSAFGLWCIHFFSGIYEPPNPPIHSQFLFGYCYSVIRIHCSSWTHTHMYIFGKFKINGRTGDSKRRNEKITSFEWRRCTRNFFLVLSPFLRSTYTENIKLLEWNRCASRTAETILA